MPTAEEVCPVRGDVADRIGVRMLSMLTAWLERRRDIRRRWQGDARRLAASDPVNACEELLAAGRKVIPPNTGIGPRLPAKSPA